MLIRLCSRWKTTGLRNWISGALRIIRQSSGTGGNSQSDSETADLVARSLIAKVCKIREGPEYDEAVRTGKAYWLSVLANRPDDRAKKRSDQALSKLLGMQAMMTGRKMSRKENLMRMIRDTFTRCH